MKKKEAMPYVCLILAPLFWAGNFIMGRFIHSEIAPFNLAFFRWLLVIMLLLPMNFSALLKSWPEIRKNIVNLLLLSILSIVIYTSFVYLGLHSTTALNASLINSAVPVLIVLLSFFLIRETLSAYKILGILLSFIGVVFVLTKGEISEVLRIQSGVGDFIILLAAASWALFSVLCKKIKIQLSPLLFLLVTAIIGDLILFPCAIMEHSLGYTSHYSWLGFSGIFYASLFSSVIAFTFWNVGIRAVGPGVASYFFNLLPVFSSVLAILLLDEKLHLYHLYGCVFVFSGIFLATRRNITARQDRAVSGLRS